jgi:arylsulfatase A-like enzyme
MENHMASPNVFMLVVDSLRVDAAFGDHVPTPNLDTLRARGATFTQAVCTTTTTTPSFSSMLTGCYPPKHGVRGLQGYRLSSQVTTMAEAFAAAGYNTYAEVTGPLLPETGVLRGFQETHHRQAYKVPFFGWRDEIVDRMHSHVEPWFVLLHIWEVHRPYRSPPTFEKQNDRAGYEAAVAATDEYLAPVFEAAGDGIIVVTGDHGEDYPDSELEIKLTRVARKARKTFKFARWWPGLEKKLAGMEIGHGFALYEHLVRVPLVIAGPGVPHTTVAEQVRHVDLFPTLADLAGLGSPAGIDGRSLVPFMEGETLPEEPAYMEAVGVKLEGKRIAGVRTPDWKLLKSGDGRPELFKLGGNGAPDEKHDLCRRHPEVARSLEAVIERVQASASVAESGMTSEEEAVIEQHLRDLGYL